MRRRFLLWACGSVVAVAALWTVPHAQFFHAHVSEVRGARLTELSLFGHLVRSERVKEPGLRMGPKIAVSLGQKGVVVPEAVRLDLEGGEIDRTGRGDQIWLYGTLRSGIAEATGAFARNLTDVRRQEGHGGTLLVGRLRDGAELRFHVSRAARPPYACTLRVGPPDGR